MEKKRCKVIILPTSQPSMIAKGKIDGLLVLNKDTPFNSKIWQNQFLYIISNDKISENDWYLNNKVLFKADNIFDEGNNPNQNINNKKVIATTDPELYYTKQNGHLGQAIIQVPQIPQQFIEDYCRKGGIEYVDVEYKKYHSGNFINVNDGKTHVVTPLLKPMANSDNIINIRPIKDTYTRDEVEEIAAKFFSLGFGESAEGRNAEILDEDEWIERIFCCSDDAFKQFIKENL